MTTKKAADRRKEQGKRTRARRDGAYIAQYVERRLYEIVARIAPAHRRTTQQMVNAVLAFGLAHWDSPKDGKCKLCLNLTAYDKEAR